MWKRLRRTPKPDTTEPMKIIAEAKEAEERSIARGEYVDVVAERLDRRIQKNHFSESLAAAWARKGEALG